MDVSSAGARWGIAAGALLLLALVLVVALDFSTGGEAEPDPLLGELGTPVRGTFVPPPTVVRPTAAPRPTVEGVAGTPAERDARRRSDLLLILNAVNTVRARDGEYPSTNDNVQTFCAYKEFDVGCKLENELGTAPPIDPLGNTIQNGYWYQSDGRRVRIFASLEDDLPREQWCPTDNVDLLEKPNLICVTAP